MPHVLVEGRIDLGRVSREWEPFLVRTRSGLARTGEVFVSPDQRSLLLEATAVDEGLTQRFFIRLSARQDGVMVRLEPLTDPQLKSDGIKTALGQVALRLRDRFGGTGFGVTNIGPFLTPPGE